MKYEYEATVVKVYDGDTITVDIDLGLDVWLKNKRIRLLGIDTPEMRGDEREQGIVIRDILREKILNRKIVLQTTRDKTGKYGRYLGVIIYDNININDWLLGLDGVKVYGK